MSEGPSSVVERGRSVIARLPVISWTIGTIARGGTIPSTFPVHFCGGEVEIVGPREGRGGTRNLQGVESPVLNLPCLLFQKRASSSKH
jgi:hypothetical protein